MQINFKFVIIIIFIKLNLIHGSNNRKTVDLNDNNIADMKKMKSPKFIQASPEVNKDTEPTLFSLLFHPPVKNRAMDIGLEDSNQGTMNAIKMNEEEEDIDKMLDDIEKNEQDQIDSFYDTFELQNAQLKEINKLF